MPAKKRRTSKKSSYKKSYSKSYYSKRPLWQWILIYLIVGGIAYILIYYFVIAKSGRHSSINYTVPASTSSPTYTIPGY
jgi:hypothetical protein